MKKIKLALLFLFATCGTKISAQGLMIWKGGTYKYVPTEEIDSIVFCKKDPAKEFTVDGHICVDLGLTSGTKWATTNVGAATPEEYGTFFAWGETKSQSYLASYQWNTYKWSQGTAAKLTKYCTEPYYGLVDGISQLLPEDDVASVAWGERWQTPTDEQQEELRKECEWTWCEDAVAGYKVTGRNGKSIFLPAAGYLTSSGKREDGTTGFYWSSTLNIVMCSQAFYLLFGKENVGRGGSDRSVGLPIRPILR